MKRKRSLLLRFRQTGDFYVFNNRHNDVQTYAVPKNLDRHSHPSGIETRSQALRTPNILDLPRKQRRFLRKDLRGHVMDKFAELKTSQALGHNRVDEFRRSMPTS